MMLKVLLIVMFIILIFITVFCLWVLAKISSVATDMEEQIEVERKLRNKND